MDFDNFLGRFVTRMEKILFRLVLVMLAVLFVIQAVLTNEDYRQYFNQTEALEGEPIIQEIQDAIGRTVAPGNTLPGQEIIVTIQLVSPPEIVPELFLLINNRVAGKLGELPFEVTVMPGDRLEVFGNVPGNEPAKVKIIHIQGEVDIPKTGDSIATFGDREVLTWIVP